MDKVSIFDTTLRDGEQCPGASMNTAAKLEVARALAALGVDVMEAGFPIASPDDFHAVRTVAQDVRGPVICALARCLTEDIDRAAEALRGTPRPRIHVFLATSKIHRERKLEMAQKEILELAVAGVTRARGYVEDVEFSPEDATRTERDFLAQVVEAAITAGAATINIPDTVGYAVPEHLDRVIRQLLEDVPNIDKAVLSVHCHNDLGLAVANSLAAVRAGARQVECTINGLGERAGNCSLEEFVMALKVRQDLYGLTTGVRTERLYPTSRLVSAVTGMAVQRNKAIVGENAFAHEAGIHQHGMLKDRRTYEIIDPAEVGAVRSRLVLGKHSGRHALAAHVKELGYQLTDEQLDACFDQFKVLADKKKEVFDEDIAALVDDLVKEVPKVYVIDSFHVSSGSATIPTAAVRLRKNGELLEDAACGDGPVDAVYKTISRIVGISPTLTDYHIRAVTGGRDAQGEVNIEASHEGRTYRGRAASTDIIEASAQAYLDVLNRIVSSQPQAEAGPEERPRV
jgi:2-isopropylmalate synthase